MIDEILVIKNKEHHSNLISTIKTILDREKTNDSGKVVNILTAIELIGRENPIPLFKIEEIGLHDGHYGSCECSDKCKEVKRNG